MLYCTILLLVQLLSPAKQYNMELFSLSIEVVGLICCVHSPCLLLLPARSSFVSLRKSIVHAGQLLINLNPKWSPPNQKKPNRMVQRTILETQATVAMTLHHKMTQILSQILQTINRWRQIRFVFAFHLFLFFSSTKSPLHLFTETYFSNRLDSHLFTNRTASIVQ